MLIDVWLNFGGIRINIQEKYYCNGWGGWGLANATTLHWNVRFSALFVIPSLKILWHWDNISVYVWVFFCGMMRNNQGGIDDHWQGINRHYINWFYHATYLATKQWQTLVFIYMHTMQRNKYEGHFLEKCKRRGKIFSRVRNSHTNKELCKKES